MSDRLTDLQSRLSADERFLDHRDLHELCRLQQAEIERLRTERFDLVPVDTVETIEEERDNLKREVKEARRVLSLAVGRDEETLAFIVEARDDEIKRLRDLLYDAHVLVHGGVQLTDSRWIEIIDRLAQEVWRW
jgi:hypothetical protein